MVAGQSIGVLALQGSFREHKEALQSLDLQVVEVRLPEDLKQVSALVLPGGESTAISRLLDTSGLRPNILERIKRNDLATFGTCAGMIISAKEVLDGVPEQQSLGFFNAQVRRNAIGPQVASFEAKVLVKGLGEFTGELTQKPQTASLLEGSPSHHLSGSFDAVFIRPPVVEAVSPEVEVLAEWNGKPVLCRQGRHMFATFHPELTGDNRIHKLFVERI